MNARYFSSALALCIATALHAEPLKLASTDVNVTAPDGATLEQRAEAAERYILQNNPGFARTQPGADALCNWLARHVASPEKKMSGKYYDIGIANFNTFDKIADAIRSAKLPPAVEKSLLNDYADRIITWRIPVDPAARATLISQASPQAVAISTDASLEKALTDQWPNYASAAPRVRKQLMDLLAEINPAIVPAGFSAWPIESPRETRPHVLIPQPDGKTVLAFRYDIRPSATLLIPGKDLLAKTAASPLPPSLPEYVTFTPPPATWYSLDLLAAASGKNLRLLLVIDGDMIDAVAQVASSPTWIRLNLVTQTKNKLPAKPPAKSSPKDDADLDEFTAPTGKTPEKTASDAKASALSSTRFPDDPAWPRTIQKNGETLTGMIPIPLAKGTLQVTLHLQLDILKGTFETVTVDDRMRTKPGASGDITAQPWTHATSIPRNTSWPNSHGPQFSGSSDSATPPLLEDPSQIRLTWLSDAPIPAGEWSDMRSISPPGVPILGGFASPIVADGRVHFFYYRPAEGKLWTPRADEHAAGGGWRERYSLRADDVLLTLDADTGKTLWKTVFPAKGANRGSMHKNGFMGTPAFAGGNVYTLGTTGRVYCLNAATGQPRWESTIGIRKQQTDAGLAYALEANTPYSTNRDFNNSLLVADGVVIACDNLRVNDVLGFRYEINDGLIGLDAATGKQLWRVPECIDGRANQPTIWKHNGKAYVIAADASGAVCIEAASGKVLWRTEGPYNEMRWIAISGDVLIAHQNMGSEKARPVAGYQLSLDGCKKIWELPSAQAGNATSGFAVHQNRVYFVSAAAKKLLCVDPQTGKILADAPHETGLNGEHDNAFVIGHGDWILTSNGRENIAFRVFSADPKNFRQLGLIDQPIAGGYCASVQPAPVDGRLIIRLQNRIACFDARAQPR